jgi:protein TonB
MKAPPTVSDVVAPPAAAEIIKSSGIGSGGSVKRSDDGEDGGGGKGLSSGSSGKAFDENEVDRAAAYTRRSDLRFPESLKSVGVQGTVVMRFIVGVDGKVEPGSIEAISSPHNLFTQAVRTALLSSRFQPAEAGGHKVRQLVEQPFIFRLQ